MMTPGGPGRPHDDHEEDDIFDEGELGLAQSEADIDVPDVLSIADSEERAADSSIFLEGEGHVYTDIAPEYHERLMKSFGNVCKWARVLHNETGGTHALSFHSELFMHLKWISGHLISMGKAAISLNHDHKPQMITEEHWGDFVQELKAKVMVFVLASFEEGLQQSKLKKRDRGLADNGVRDGIHFISKRNLDFYPHLRDTLPQAKAQPRQYDEGDPKFLGSEISLTVLSEFYRAFREFANVLIDDKETGLSFDAGGARTIDALYNMLHRTLEGGFQTRRYASLQGYRDHAKEAAGRSFVHEEAIGPQKTVLDHFAFEPSLPYFKQLPEIFSFSHPKSLKQLVSVLTTVNWLTYEQLATLVKYLKELPSNKTNAKVIQLLENHVKKKYSIPLTSKTPEEKEENEVKFQQLLAQLFSPEVHEQLSGLIDNARITSHANDEWPKVFAGIIGEKRMATIIEFLKIKYNYRTHIKGRTLRDNLSGRLGIGAQGVVFLAERNADNIPAEGLRMDSHGPDVVAIKFATQDVKQINHEIAQLLHLNGVPNSCIVPLLTRGFWGELPYFEMPYYPLNLDKAIHQCVEKNELFPFYWNVIIAIRIFLGICQIHLKRRVHRDLKPSNIMADDDGNIFLVDFGVAGQIYQGGVNGTLAFMPPEAIFGEEDYTRDVYSAWVSMYYFMSGGDNYVETKEIKFGAKMSETEKARVRNEAYVDAKDKKMSLTADKVLEKLNALQKLYPDVYFPQDLIKLMARGLSIDPKERPSSFATLRELCRIFPQCVSSLPLDTIDFKNEASVQAFLASIKTFMPAISVSPAPLPSQSTRSTSMIPPSAPKNKEEEDDDQADDGVDVYSLSQLKGVPFTRTGRDLPPPKGYGSASLPFQAQELKDFSDPLGSGSSLHKTTEVDIPESIREASASHEGVDISADEIPGEVPIFHQVDSDSPASDDPFHIEDDMVISMPDDEPDSAFSFPSDATSSDTAKGHDDHSEVDFQKNNPTMSTQAMRERIEDVVGFRGEDAPAPLQEQQDQDVVGSVDVSEDYPFASDGSASGEFDTRHIRRADMVDSDMNDSIGSSLFSSENRTDANPSELPASDDHDVSPLSIQSEFIGSPPADIAPRGPVSDVNISPLDHALFGEDEDVEDVGNDRESHGPSQDSIIHGPTIVGDLSQTQVEHFRKEGIMPGELQSDEATSPDDNKERVLPDEPQDGASDNDLRNNDEAASSDSDFDSF